MKQCYAFLCCLLFQGVITFSASAQEWVEKNYPAEIAVYVFDSCSVELNHTLFDVQGSILMKADTLQDVIFPHDNFTIDYNHGKWRMQSFPNFYPYNSVRKKGKTNFLNGFDDDRNIQWGHDNIVMQLHMKDTVWTDTLPKSKEIAIVVFGTNVPAKLMQLLDTVNVLVLQKRYAEALECMRPVVSCCAPEEDSRFMAYYHHWITVQEKQSREAALPKKNKGRKSKNERK